MPHSLLLFAADFICQYEQNLKKMASVSIVVWLFNLIYELSIFHSRWLFVVWITICLQFFHWLFTIDNVSSLHSAAVEWHVQIKASPSRVVISWINFNSYLFYQRLLFLRLWQKNNTFHSNTQISKPCRAPSWQYVTFSLFAG